MTDSTIAPFDWPKAWPATGAQAEFKTVPEDFRVTELPQQEPSGEGEHVWLWIEKRGANTAFVAAELARMAGVRELDVGFAGLKDRHAVTAQWFSLYIPKGDVPDFLAVEHAEFRVLRQQRHHRKLRRGDLLGNRFELRLRNVVGDHEAVERNLQSIATIGYPNYFGAQRFGHDGGNVEQGMKMLRREIRVRNANKKSIYLSSVRSFLFNEVLARRVKLQNWHQYLDGDPGAEGLPTGPLWGRGQNLASGICEEIETAVLEPYADIRDALEHAGLQQERRQLVVKPDMLKWQWLPTEESDSHTDLTISFCLGAGFYATSLLEELLQLTEPERELVQEETPAT